MNRSRIALLATVAGAIALSACATLEDEIFGGNGDTYRAVLTGANEVGGGDSDGYGEAEITVNNSLDQICWELSEKRNLGTITAAHIHRGAAGTNGPPVFTLNQVNSGRDQDCTDADQTTRRAIEDNPAGHYVNVHTSQFPDGAIRGQLRNDD